MLYVTTSDLAVTGRRESSIVECIDRPGAYGWGSVCRREPNSLCRIAGTRRSILRLQARNWPDSSNSMVTPRQGNCARKVSLAETTKKNDCDLSYMAVDRYKAALKSMVENAEAPLLPAKGLDHCLGAFGTRSRDRDN